MNARRLVGVGVAALAMLGVTPYFSGAVAQAFVGHVFAPPPFGSLTQAKGVAIDQTAGSTAGNVFVVSSGVNAVAVFSSSGGAPAGGAPAGLTGAGTPAGSFSLREKEFPFVVDNAGLAIDDSGGASNGDIYVADSGHNVVDKFKLNASHEYEYICQLTGVKGGCEKNEPTVESAPEHPFENPTSVAVDSGGNVYVTNYANKPATDEFTATGEDVRQIHVGLLQFPVGMAVDSAGNLYAYSYRSGVVKLTRDASGNVESESVVAPEGPESTAVRAIAIDTTTSPNQLYVDHGDYIEQFTTSGVLLNEFGLGTLNVSAGIAIDGTTGELYASEFHSGTVDAFVTATLPDATVGLVEEVAATSATVTGTINPDGIDASSTVDYGTTTAYGSSVATVQATGGPNPGSNDDGSGSAPVPVKATLANLIPNTTYHYRIDGTNSNGTYHTPQDHTFTTLLAPPSVGEPSQAAANFAPLAGSVLLRATVNPENSPTTYHFVYGPTSAYGSRIPASEASVGSGFEVLPVSQVVEGLTPGATYHFALVAVNAAGTTTGPDVTFTARPPAVITGAASGVTYTTAILSGSVSPEGLKSTYQFETGTDTSYGSITGATDAGAGLAAQPVTASLENLQPGTTYHYRILATSQNGTSYGTDQTFTTPGVPSSLAIPPAAPLLATTPMIAFPTEAKAVVVKKASKKTKKRTKAKPRPRKKHKKKR